MAQLIIGMVIPLPAEVFERAEFLVSLKPCIDAIREGAAKADGTFEVREEASCQPPGAQEPPVTPRKKGRPTNAERAAAQAATFAAMAEASYERVTE
jgi:hypothetical protein